MNLEDRRHAEALLEASHGDLFVVALGETPDDPLYTENPEEQGLTETQPQEYLVRVFSTRGAADLYREAVRALFPYEFAVKHFSAFEELWPELEEADRIYMHAVGLHARAVMSTMVDGEHPRDIVTIFSPAALRN